MSATKRSPKASKKLARYREKRDFDRTPEPAGASAPPESATGRRFVVQRHRARRLHYDLRFEIDGVLASWAVPRGPTLDPRAKRTAVHVEDHPIEYLDFEGVIPKGEYGGGDVIVWDIGTWEPRGTDDPATAVAAGELHADIYGHKLRGRLVLVRRDRNGSGARTGREQWLLVHKRDEHAVDGWDAEDHPRSVLSGRTNEEVKADPDRMWRSDLPAAEASIALRPTVVAGPSADEHAALDALGRKREVGGVRPYAAADQPRQGVVPRSSPGVGDNQARVRSIRRTDCARRSALPRRPAVEHAPLPERRGVERLLAQAGSSARSRVALSLGQPSSRPGRDDHVPSGQRACRAGLGGELRRIGMARLDLADRRSASPDVRADRPRPWRGHQLGRRADSGPAPSHRLGTSRRPGRSRNSPAGAASRSGFPSPAGRRSPKPEPGSSSCHVRSPRWCRNW